MLTQFDENNINILNGEAMYQYLSQHGVGLQNCASFNEAMCVGKHISDIFSEEYVRVRCNALNTDIGNYTEKLLSPLQKVLKKDNGTLVLWFDHDMFCQINLLVLLAYLEQIDYKRPIILNQVDHFNKFIASHSIRLNNYKQLFCNVLIEYKQSQNIGPALLSNGIELYLEYIKGDNEIIRFIQSNRELGENVILEKLLTNFSNYGLGDTQYLQMIKKQILS